MKYEVLGYNTFHSYKKGLYCITERLKFSFYDEESIVIELTYFYRMRAFDLHIKCKTTVLAYDFLGSCNGGWFQVKPRIRENPSHKAMKYLQQINYPECWKIILQHYMRGRTEGFSHSQTLEEDCIDLLSPDIYIRKLSELYLKAAREN